MVVCVNSLFPDIPFRIQQIEASLYLLKADAMTASVLFRLGEIGILDRAYQLFLTTVRWNDGLNENMDKAGFRQTDAMFESVLYQRDEDQRSHSDICIRLRPARKALVTFRCICKGFA